MKPLRTLELSTGCTGKFPGHQTDRDTKLFCFKFFFICKYMDLSETNCVETMKEMGEKHTYRRLFSEIQQFSILTDCGAASINNCSIFDRFF